jgi:hypothetical protein
LPPVHMEVVHAKNSTVRIDALIVRVSPLDPAFGL